MYTRFPPIFIGFVPRPLIWEALRLNSWQQNTRKFREKTAENELYQGHMFETDDGMIGNDLQVMNIAQMPDDRLRHWVTARFGAYEIVFWGKQTNLHHEI
jgi:hypothetical protein